MTSIDLDKYWPSSNDRYSNRNPLFGDVMPVGGDHIDWLENCKRIVDLGCGIGNLVKWLQQNGHEAVGLTYQQEEVDKSVSSVLLGDVHAPPFEDGSFDGMVMWDVLEHCLAPLVVLKEARRIVTNEGRGLLFMPGPGWQSCDYHILVLDESQVRHLCDLSGWLVASASVVDAAENTVYRLKAK